MERLDWARVSTSARLGTWLGGFGWWIGTVLALNVHAPRFAAELAGGAVLTLGALLGLEWIMRRAPRPHVALWGCIGLACGAIGLYIARFIEPAVNAHPDVLADLHRMGASVVFPAPLAVVCGVLGAGATAAAFLPERPSDDPL